MAQAVLINVFEVPEGRDDEFLAEWAQGKQWMERQPGYVSTALHRSLDPRARFRYVNVAVWERAEDFQAALEHPEFAAYRERVAFAHYPSVYTIVSE